MGQGTPSASGCRGLPLEPASPARMVAAPLAGMSGPAWHPVSPGVVPPGKGGRCVSTPEGLEGVRVHEAPSGRAVPHWFMGITMTYGEGSHAAGPGPTNLWHHERRGRSRCFVRLFCAWAKGLPFLRRV